MMNVSERLQQLNLINWSTIWHCKFSLFYYIAFWVWNWLFFVCRVDL